jgi:hypothetical protein
MSEGPQKRLGATDSGLRPGRYARGSAQSRAAAKAMVVARKASEEEQGFQVVTRFPYCR